MARTSNDQPIVVPPTQARGVVSGRVLTVLIVSILLATVVVYFMVAILGIGLQP